MAGYRRDHPNPLPWTKDQSGHLRSHPVGQKNRYSTVQPRLYDWTMDGKGPDPPGLPVPVRQPILRSSSKDSKNLVVSHERISSFESRALKKSPRDCNDTVPTDSSRSRGSGMVSKETKLTVKKLIDEIYST